MNLGLTGNGFDFLIDPYRHGGQPAVVTSVPYPAVVEEAMQGLVEGAWDVSILGFVESMEGVVAVALEGSWRDIRVTYTYGPDEIEPVMATALSGTLVSIRQSYTYGPDEIEGVMPTALSGTWKRIRIELTMPRDDMTGVMAIALGGTLV
jgi:hypothetical protein